MEGFLNLKWSRWQRVLLTRTLAIAPTLAVTLTSDINQLTGMNDYLNALMSLQLPFALLPALTFSSSRYVMGDFANGIINRIIASLLSVIIISINIYFVVDLVSDKFEGKLWAYVLLAIFGAYYVTFVAYLVNFDNIPIIFNPKSDFKNF
jgi:natural resistance-associated macrophage protein